MLRNWKYITVLTGLLMSASHSLYAAEYDDSLEMDDPEQSIAEVPVESIEQFVQIYGTVKQNYVTEKSDDALFLQAIKGLVGGLDRYSRYLSPEEYKQLVQYTESDLATVDFELNYDNHNRQWQIKNLTVNSDSYKLGLKNGFTIFKLDNQELKNLNREQVEDLLHGSIGSTLQLQLNANSPVMSIVRNKKMDVADIEATLLHNQVLVLHVRVFQQDTANEIKRLIEVNNPSKLKELKTDETTKNHLET